MEYEKRLLLINTSGSGDVLTLPLSADGTEITSDEAEHSNWELIKHISDFAVVVYDNRMFLIGGYDNPAKECMNRVMSYNPMTDSWEFRRSLMQARKKCSAVPVTDGILVSGGIKNDKKLTASSEWYEDKENKWHRAGMMPEPRWGHKCAFGGDLVYLSGGYTTNGCADDNFWQWDKNDVTNWRDLDDDYPLYLSRPIYKHNMVMVNGRLYFMGGVRTKTRKNGETKEYSNSAMQSFMPKIQRVENYEHQEDEDVNDNGFNIEDEEEEWDKMKLIDHNLISPWDNSLPDMPEPRYDAAAIGIGNKIYTFGGCKLDKEGEPTPCENVYYFDIDERKWHLAFNLNSGNISKLAAVIMLFPVKTKPKPPDASLIMPIICTEELQIVPEINPEKPLVEIEPKKWILF